MDPKILKAAIEALKNGDGDAALALLEDMLTGAGSGEPGEPAEGAPASATGEPAEEPPPPAAAAPTEEPATAMLLRVTGARSLADAEPILRSAIMSARTIDADRAAMTLAARRELIADLIALGAETPATAWEGPADQRKPVARLAAETIESMRARVTSLKARGGAPSVLGHAPPANLSDAVAQLSPDLLAQIKAKGMTPEQFVAEREKATRSVTTRPTA